MQNSHVATLFVILALITFLCFRVGQRIYREIKGRDRGEISRGLSVDRCPCSLFEVSTIILWIIFGLSQVVLLSNILRRGNLLQTLEGEASLQIFTACVMYGIFFFLVTRLLQKKGSNWTTAFGFKSSLKDKLISAVLIVFAMSLGLTAVGGAVTKGMFYMLNLPLEPQPIIQLILNLQNPWLLSGMILAAVFGAPFCEETLFRGMIYPMLKERFGRLHALWLNSVIFAELHLHIPGYLPLFILSVMLTLLYEWKSNLTACMICHSAYNIYSLCLLFSFK